MRTAAVTITVAFLVLAGGPHPQVNKLHAAAITNWDAPTPKPLHGRFTRSKAMTVVYGNYNIKSGTSTVQDLSDYAPELGKREGVIRVMFDAPYSENAAKYWMLVTYAAPKGDSFDCHPCTPSVSAFLFKQQGNEWSLKNAGYDLSVGGGNGKPTPVKLIRVGASRHGLNAQPYYMAQGEESEGFMIFLPNDDGFSEVFNVNTVSDNLANCKVRGVDCSRKTGEVEFVPDLQKEIWDIHVTQREVVNGKVVTTAKTSTYEFINRKYKIRQ